MNKGKMIDLAGTVTVGPKGQVVIPVEVRADMGIEPGDKLLALYVPSKKSVVFVSEEAAQHYIEEMGARFIHLKKQFHKGF